MTLSIQNTSKKEMKKNFKFPQKWWKDKTFQIFSPALHLEGWVDILEMNT